MAFTNQDKQTLAEILVTVKRLEKTGVENMGQIFTDLDALRQAINEATNAVAAKIAELGDAIKNAMTDEEVAALKAGIQAEVDRLNALAADPADPVP